MQTELRSRRSAPSKGIAGWGVRHGLLDCEGRLHPLREMWYSLQIGAARPQQICRRVAGRETEHQHFMVFVGDVRPAQGDVRSCYRPLIQAERAITDLDVDRRRTGWRSAWHLPLPS